MVAYARLVVVLISVSVATALLSTFTHAQTSPPQVSPRSRSEAWSVFGYDPSADFRAFDPQYRDKINRYKDELERLRQEMFHQASAGRKTPCARQVYVEAKWLIQYTADFDRIDKRLQALRDLLKQPHDPPEAKEQSPIDGSFNPCNQAWFYKLDAACDKLVVMQYLDAKPKYPLRFLDQINSPDRYRAYMDRLLVADVSKTGEDTRFELNIAGTDLVRLILGTLPSGYTFHPQLKAVMLDYLDNKWQDPQTGFWGCRYKTRDGSIRKTADMSTTFHIVHYRDGKVGRWPRIIATLFAMKNLEWPFGWLQDGQMSDHHNYDVVTLFHYGWSAMTPQQKTQARAEIRKMLDFCLTKSLRPDGSFNLNDEDTIGESYAFPCQFLYEIGFFHKENRFWTQETFPQAKAIARRIAGKIKALKLDDPETQVAQLIVESAD
jgi:hypothetical protein